VRGDSPAPIANIAAVISTTPPGAAHFKPLVFIGNLQFVVSKPRAPEPVRQSLVRCQDLLPSRGNFMKAGVRTGMRQSSSVVKGQETEFSAMPSNAVLCVATSSLTMLGGRRAHALRCAQARETLDI
jgi:hypothetical protein